jgi:hypothetical protein
VGDVGILGGHLCSLRPNGTFYGHLVHFVVIWYIFPVLVCCPVQNLATLLPTAFLSIYRVINIDLKLDREEPKNLFVIYSLLLQYFT